MSWAGRPKAVRKCDGCGDTIPANKVYCQECAEIIKARNEAMRLPRLKPGSYAR